MNIDPIPAAAVSRIPPRLHRMCDDESMFPPAGLSVAEALTSHLEHARSDHRRILGPLLVPARYLDELARLAEHPVQPSLWFAVAVPSPTELGDAMSRAIAIPGARFAGAEVGIPDSMASEDVVPALAAGFERTGIDFTEVYVEVPWDERRTAVLDALADSDFDAKFRIGGHPDPDVHAHTPLVPVTDDLQITDTQLADTVIAAVSRHLPFMVSGAAHRAVRCTEKGTGRELHGFLNLFLAVDTARQGVDSDDGGVRDQVIATLADRDGPSVARRFRTLSPERALAARSSFTSLGIHSILDPLNELIELGLVAPSND